jgi:hypothetical protein
MSLMDALVVLDPYPFEVWVAFRSSGEGSGSGTASDPYDGRTASKFDQIMRSFPAGVPVTVHLGPSPLDGAGNPIPFQTQGYYVGAASNYGWRARANMRILGAGVAATFLQVVSVTQNAHYYAIAHDLASGTTLDYLEIADLCIDCGLPSGMSGPACACGAVRVAGDQVKVRRIKAVNFGGVTH